MQLPHESNIIFVFSGLINSGIVKMLCTGTLYFAQRFVVTFVENNVTVFVLVIKFEVTSLDCNTNKQEKKKSLN